MQTTFTPGQTVYSTDGAMALYVSTAKGGGFIVQPLHEDGDGGTEPENHYAEGVEIWPTVHKEPPQPMLAAEIAEQQETLAALRREILDAERQKREVDRGMAALKERLGVHAALAALDGLLSGQVTHYVIDWSDNNNRMWKVVKAEEFHTLRTHYSTVSMRLWVNLNWTNGGRLQWKYTPNAEGNRDREHDIFPFFSEEDARAKMVAMVTAEVLETAKSASNAYWIRQRIEWCRQQGVEVPVEASSKLADLERREADAAAEKARTELAAAQAKLNELNAA